MMDSGLDADASPRNDSGDYRTVAKNFLTSRTNSSGCSKAAKCPPFSISLQCVMSGKFGSIQRRTGVMISLGNTATPVGTFTTGVVRRLPKLSQ